MQNFLQLSHFLSWRKINNYDFYLICVRRSGPPKTASYVLIQRIKNCHQHSYGFRKLMSCWGSWSKNSKLTQVGDFSFFAAKSSLWVSKLSFNFVYTFNVHTSFIDVLLHMKQCGTNRFSRVELVQPR